MPEPPPRVYARHLLPFDYGYPLWTPEPGHQFLRYRSDGLRIGDVGVIVPENGSFDVFFNICLPRDHPFHRVNGVPDNFVHVDLDDLDVAIYPNAENSGSVISTSAATALRTVGPPDGAGRQNAPTYEFNLSSNEGALLILPDGAESYCLLKRMAFRDVATQNGVDWYNFAEQRLGRIITHDSLYLITGCYKSHSWSVAAFHEVSSQTGVTQFPAQFKAGQPTQGDISATYTWETTRALHWRVGPLGSGRTGFPNQAVFISGFKIALRDSILGKKRVEVDVDAPPIHPTKLYDSGKGHSRSGRIWRRLLSKSGSDRRGGGQVEADSANDPGTSSRVADDSSDGKQVTISHIPETAQSLHPSDIINRYLLSKEPSATLAVTHDSQWGTLFEKGMLKPEDLGDETRLQSTVFENYRSVTQDGVVYLQPISDSSIRFMDIDDAVREALSRDKLEDAEEILSRQIIHRTSSDHHAFAHRALIRARLHHWDAALRDAETSIGIQPSITAHVARGFALFGQQKYASAVHAFNVALRDCDVRDKIIVSLIKSIILLEVGYRAESMAEIADLVEHCSGQVKLACHTAQAAMYARLATQATVKGEYDRALQLLSRAQSLGPFHEAPELEILTLLCGWSFGDLQFSIYRQKCEALYVGGQINETIESLNESLRDLDDSVDVRTKEHNARWITTFTQDCLKSVESLGDSALASQDYAKAIAHYSVALTIGPTSRDRTLVKRSAAYIASGTWDKALDDADEAITLKPLLPWGYERRFAVLQSMGRYDEAIQAFENMLSTLEQLSRPPARQLHLGHTGETMALQRLDPHSSAPRDPDHRSIVNAIMSAIQDVDSRRATEILNMLRAERDEMIRERMSSSTDQVVQQQQALVVAGAEETLGTGFIVSEGRPNEQAFTSERYQKLHNQLTELMHKYKKVDDQPELMKAVLRLAEQQLVLRPQQDDQGNVPVFELLDELREYNAKQEEILDALSDHWKKGTTGGKGEQQAGGETDREKLHYGFRRLRDDFTDALATEAQMIVEEVARLGGERRRLQQELGQLMVMKSKYGPGGEFDPEWKPPAPAPPQAPPLPALEKMPVTHPQKELMRHLVPPLPTGAKSTHLGNTKNTRAGWRSVAPVRGRRPTTVEGLLGPSTPTKTSLLDIERIQDPNLTLAYRARPVSLSETLAWGHFDGDESIWTSSRASPLSKSSLDFSSAKSGAPSTPSPLSLSSLDDSKFDVPEELALSTTGSSSARGFDVVGGAIDM